MTSLSISPTPAAEKTAGVYVFVTFVTVQPHDPTRPTIIEFYRIPLSVFYSAFSEYERLDMAGYCISTDVYEQWLTFLKDYQKDIQAAGDAQDIDMTDVVRSFCLQHIVNQSKI
jgi:hypothetical protein